MNIENRIQKVINTLLLIDKFVHYFLFKVQIRPNKGCGTACIGVCKKTNRIVLEYSPKFLESLKDEEITYIFIHEIYHLVLKHIFKNLPRKEERELHNIAYDCAVNSLIREVKGCIEAPEGAVLPSHFGFPSGLTGEKYIILLREKFNNLPNNTGNNNEGSNALEDSSTTPDEGKGNTNKNKKVKDSNTGIDNHDLWGENSVLEDFVTSLVESSTKREFWGSVPGEIKEAVESYLRNKVNWIKKLRLFGMGINRSPSVVFSSKKRNRRYGFIYPGRSREYIDKVVVAIDTSGSITQENLSQFLAEINKISDIAPVELITFDTKIQQCQKWKKRRKFEFNGRGGTNYKEVMDYVEKNKVQYLIVLTDGYASNVSKPKYLKKCLWVLVNNKETMPWGETIHID